MPFRTKVALATSTLLALVACATGQLGAGPTLVGEPDGAVGVDSGVEPSPVGPPLDAGALDGPADATVPVDASPPPHVDAAADAFTDAVPSASHLDSGIDTGPTLDASPFDAHAVDAHVPDAGAVDANVADANLPDTSTAPTATPAAVGDLVISEVMYYPTDTGNTGEWIELYNTTSDTKLLTGLTLQDATHSHTIAAASQVTIAPNSYALLVRDSAQLILDQIPASAIAYQYSTIALANGSTGTISLSNGSTVLASVPYGPWALLTQSGSSIQLMTLSASDDTDSLMWCAAVYPWATGDNGTPGSATVCF